MRKSLVGFLLFFVVGLSTAYITGSNGGGTLDNLRECEKEEYDALNFQSSKRYSCYSKALIAAVKGEGIREAVEALGEYQKTDEGSLLTGARCHALGHDIGLAAVTSGNSPQTVLKECLNFCEELGDSAEGLDFGCLNGAAHAYVLYENSTGDLEKYCDIPGVSQDVREGCYHGIGHGVAEYTLLDIEKALLICDGLETREARYQCGHAILMAPEHFSYPNKASLPEDLVQFCSTRNEAYSPSCFEFAAFLEYSRVKDARTALLLCGKVPGEFQRVCQERLGEAIFFNLKHSPSSIAQSCSVQDKEVTKACLYGANRISIDGADSPFGELGLEVCKYTDSGVRGDCYADLALLVSRRHGEERRQALCFQVPPLYEDRCRAASL